MNDFFKYMKQANEIFKDYLNNFADGKEARQRLLYLESLYKGLPIRFSQLLPPSYWEK